MESAKKYLLGMTLGELKEVAKSLGMPAFTGGQIAKWLYTQHVKSIDEMTNISKERNSLLNMLLVVRNLLMHNILKTELSNISSLLTAVSSLKQCIYQTKTVPRFVSLHK